jgi:hypothetical protein
MLTGDFFYEKRNNILMDRESVPLYLGVTPAAGNLGEPPTVVLSLKSDTGTK